MTNHLVMFGTAIMTTLLALAVIWQFRIVALYVLVSLVLAAAMRPLVNRLVRQGLVRRMAWILLYLFALGSFGILFYMSAKYAIKEIQQLAHTVSVQDEWQLPIWLEESLFQQALISRLPPPSKLFEAITGDRGQLVLPAILGFTQNIGSVVSGVVVILFLSLYWSINQIHFERLWLSLLPSEVRKHARGIWRIIEPDLGAYIRSEAVQSVLAALLLGLGYWLLGSPYPILLALIGALAWLVPVVGAALAIIPPLVLGLLTGVELSLFTVFYTLAILFILQVWIEPRLFKRQWDNPILTLIILLAMADAFGLLGILVTPPLSIVCQILWNLLVRNRLASGAATQVADLKERQVRLLDAVNLMSEPRPPLIASSMERLNSLLTRAEPVLQTGLLVEPSNPLLRVTPPSD